MISTKVGLALGGGGARGIAHIGILKVLEEHNIQVDCIAGTSIGALIAAGYAIHPDANLLNTRMRRFLTSKEFLKSGLSRFKRKEPAENFFGQVAKFVKQRIVINLAHSRLSVVSGERLDKIIRYVLENRNIEQTKIPLAIVASDLVTGRPMTFRSGSIRKATLASASIPGFLPPVQYNGNLLVDGAVTSPIPVEAVQELGANLIIGVDVGQDVQASNDATDNIVDLMFRTSTITANTLRSLILEKADFALRPNVGDVHWADFSQFERMVKEGEAVCREIIPDLQKLIKQKNSVLYRLTHNN